jgi:short-subunit dehydrogenase
VTGASSGIGRATALRLAASGAHLVLVARGGESLHESAAECTEAGAASTRVILADVGDDAAVEKLFSEVLETHADIDAVVHSAGVVAYGRTEEIPPEVFEGVLQTNLIGSVNVARHSIQLFRARNHGHLVLVGSVIGHIAVPSMSPYVLSKWGVRALARQLKVENMDRSGVQISYAAPGGVDTPIYEQAANYAGLVGRPPPPVITPETVARAIERQLTGLRHREQIGSANDVLRLGHTMLPWVYDRLVGPLYRLAARDQTHQVSPNPGNVLSSGDPSNRLRGEQGNALAAIGRNIFMRLDQARGGLRRDPLVSDRWGRPEPWSFQVSSPTLRPCDCRRRDAARFGSWPRRGRFGRAAH